MDHKERQQTAWTAVQYIDTAMVGSLGTQATAAVGATSTIAWLVGSTVLRMVAVSEPFYGVSIIVEGLMMGVGKTKTPFLYNITGMWCVRILGTMICTRFLGMGLISAWACMIAHNMLLFCLYLVTFIRRSWNPLNVEQS